MTTNADSCAVQLSNGVRWAFNKACFLQTVAKRGRGYRCGERGCAKEADHRPTAARVARPLCHRSGAQNCNRGRFFSGDTQQHRSFCVGQGPGRMNASLFAVGLASLLSPHDNRSTHGRVPHAMVLRKAACEAGVVDVGCAPEGLHNALHCRAD